MQRYAFFFNYKHFATILRHKTLTKGCFRKIKRCFVRMKGCFIFLKQPFVRTKQSNVCAVSANIRPILAGRNSK
ncbi:MAG: hypothetical protein LBL74_08205 [Bacteroidales bacterium]|nr:hypothetical protein [Bacteroidales bacterium]